MLAAASAAFLACISVALGQDISSDGGGSKVAYIVRTASAPVIDGVLDDEAWSHANVIDDFHQVTPVEYAAPTQKTQVLLLYDSDALYIGVRLYRHGTREDQFAGACAKAKGSAPTIDFSS